MKTDIRSRILSHLLPLVPFDGWSDYSLRTAASQAGLDPAQAFPGGIAECLEYFFSQNDEALEARFSAGSLKTLRVPDRIETLIMAKLESFAPHREAVRRAISQRLMPWNAAAGIKSLYHSVDSMWRLAGDESLDFSFYTKRATLAGLYSSTLLYWLQDESHDDAAVRAFLKRRLGDIAAFGKWKKQVTGFMSKRAV